MSIDRTRYFTFKQVLLLHELVMDLYAPPGNKRGPLHPQAIQTMLDGMKQPWYEDVLHKAAYMFQTIAHDHLFQDGNKRTATFCVDIFLGINGYKLIAPESKLEKLALRIAKGECTINKIRRNLERYSVYIADPQSIREAQLTLEGLDSAD